MKALSIRQPWAWLIMRGFKDIENRTWRTHYRGRVFIHASQTMTQLYYKDCITFVSRFNPRLARLVPSHESLKLFCGGIVGEVKITDCVTASESPWFVGDFGFVLFGAKPLPFRPLTGELGLFDVEAK